ncbi:helix-turn-helix domain-containing protein [Sphingomonas sp. LY54]|uniref:helix-turn-helix domain-containing protein n=1 Tax=Sphingomonas sp. LY54 TaxID=3095343 RepID=UPI002D796CDF|nr:helix-turn-helix domain-containing protein [Sphingomonas sp. LY54]WRP30008.1 helix-turn-helix domain-containing protein [Sphingomonas sp. LY54]
MSIGRIETAAPCGPARLALAWDDDRRAELDLAPLIAARPVLAPLADPETFRNLRLTEDGWSIEWPGCGIDLGAGQLRRWADEQAGEAMPAPAFRAWMERHGLTLDRAAEALGLSRRTVAYYLSGEQPVPKTVMLATEGYDRRQAA